jgi:DNA polymerase-1
MATSTGIVAHVDQIGGKAGTSLRDHLDGVLRNRRLNQLVRDLDLPVELGDLERRTWDREEVHERLRRLEFRVLRDRLFATFDRRRAPAAEIGGLEIDGHGPGLGRRCRVARAARRGGLARAAVRRQWGRGTGDALAVGPGHEGRRGGYVDVTGLDDVAERALARWLADPNAPKVLHDAKGPIHGAGGAGLGAGHRQRHGAGGLPRRPDQRDYDLADLVVRHLGGTCAMTRERTGQGMLDFGDDDDAPRTRRWSAPGRSSTSADALDR